VTRPLGSRLASLAALLLVALCVHACEATPGVAPHERASRPPAIVEAPDGRDRPGSESATDSVRGRDLREDERRGGHTIERHVGKSDEDLRARLKREPRIAAASTYTDLAVAERVVAEALREAAGQVERWTARTGRRPNLALDYDGAPGTIVGRSLRRGRPTAERCTDAVVVLRWDERRDDYFVLTSYPEVRR
jgi:hypothetical protein